MHSDMNFCVDCKSEAAGNTKHMSSQGGLELLVNCITEGCLPQGAVQNVENSYFSKIHHHQHI